MMKRILFQLMFVMSISTSAFAACSNPTGTFGQIDFNDDYNILQYCDDTDWRPMYLNDYRANGVTFDGTNDYLSTNTLTGVVDGKKVTGSVWFRRSDTTAASQNIFSTAPTSFRISMNSSSLFYISGVNGAAATVLDIRAGTVADMNWHHLMFSADLSDPAKRHVYLDGVSTINVITFIDDIINFTESTNYISHNGVNKFRGDLADLWIDFGTYIDLSDADERAKFIDARGKPMNLGTDGSRPLGVAPDIFLSGATTGWETNKATGGGFTENGALTDATSDPSDHNLSVASVGHWKLDENAGSSAADSSANGLTGTLVNSPTWVAGKMGSALNFSGTNQYVSSPYNAALALSLPITLSAWVKVNPGGSGWVIATSGQTGGGNYAGAYLHVSETSVFGQYGSNTSGAAAGRRTGTTNVTVPPDTWTHVAVVINGATNMVIYVNGVDSGALTYSGSGGTIAYDVANPLMIGQGHINNGSYFNGSIDDARVYGTALTAAQVSQLAQKCASPAATAGTIIYNTDDHVMQFCDGRDWLAMAEAGDGGAGCANPTGVEGEMIYNTDWKTMQYCEGDDWIALGKTCREQPGIECEDGTVYAGLSPDGNVPMYTTHCDEGQSWNGSVCTGTRISSTWNAGNGAGLVTTGITSSTTGETNTTALVGLDADSVTGGFQNHYAAHYCNDLVTNGHDDWYLPGRNEATNLGLYRDAIGGFQTVNVYWTSSEATNSSAYYLRQTDGAAHFNTNKNFPQRIRCVRKD